MRCVLRLLVAVILAALPGPAVPPGWGAPAGDRSGAAETDWLPARPDHVWNFPRDHWTHPGYRSEWWYFTGHVETDEPAARRFGYQFTIFRVGLLPESPPFASSWSASDLVMGHAAISDLDTGGHRFSELLYRAVPLLGGFPTWPAGPAGIGGETGGDGGPSPIEEGVARAAGRLAWCRAPAGTDSVWTLDWNGTGFAFRARDEARGFSIDLQAIPERPCVLEGPNGFSPKGEEGGAASLYYSFTRLATKGTLVIDGRRLRVHGRSWMDKEFGSGVLAARQSGWDWFSLQLEDGRDLMLYLLRDRSGGIDFARGTLVEADGTVRYLDRPDFAVQSEKTWKSPATGAEYPALWTVRIDGARPPLRVQVVPELADQENRGKLARGLFYWEGAVEVRGPGGERIGHGYVELTGYGTNNRPAL